MHLLTLGLAPLLFVLGTRAQVFIAATTNNDGTQGVLQGCYSNVNFNLFDSAPYITSALAAASVQGCVNYCRVSGYTYAMEQGYLSKSPTYYGGPFWLVFANIDLQISVYVQMRSILGRGRSRRSTPVRVVCALEEAHRSTVLALREVPMDSFTRSEPMEL